MDLEIDSCAAMAVASVEPIVRTLEAVDYRDGLECALV